MQLNTELKPALKNINFEERYKNLSEMYPYADQSFEKYSNEKVLLIFESLEHSFKFNKRENFFGYREKVEDYDFAFNISLKYGLTELIWSIHKNGKLMTLGGPWAVIIRLLNDGKKSNIKKPSFRNYEDLRLILKDSFEIFEDFKSEVLKLKP